MVSSQEIGSQYLGKDGCAHLGNGWRIEPITGSLVREEGANAGTADGLTEEEMSHRRADQQQEQIRRSAREVKGVVVLPSFRAQ